MMEEALEAGHFSLWEMSGSQARESFCSSQRPTICGLESTLTDQHEHHFRLPRVRYDKPTLLGRC